MYSLVVAHGNADRVSIACSRVVSEIRVQAYCCCRPTALLSARTMDADAFLAAQRIKLAEISRAGEAAQMHAAVIQGVRQKMVRASFPVPLHQVWILQILY